MLCNTSLAGENPSWVTCKRTTLPCLSMSKSTLERCLLENVAASSSLMLKALAHSGENVCHVKLRRRPVSAARITCSSQLIVMPLILSE
jgi:hypothetical protein